MDDITTTLGMNTGPFARALRGVEGMVTKFGRGMASSMMGGFAFGGAAAFAKTLIDWGSHITDLHERTDVATDSLQGYALAAELTGASVEDVAQAIKKLRQAQGAALSGSKDMEASLKALGITMQNLQTMNAEALFDKISRSIEESGLAAAHFDDFLKVLGKTSDKLIPAMQQGMAGVAEEFKKFGVSKEALKNVDDLGDAAAMAWHIIRGGATETLGAVVAYEKALGRIAAILFLMPKLVVEKGRGATGTKTSGISEETMSELLLGFWDTEDEHSKSLVKALNEAKNKRAESFALAQKESAEVAKQTALLYEQVAKGKELEGDTEAVQENLRKRIAFLEMDVELESSAVEKEKKRIELQKAKNELLEKEIKAKKESAKADDDAEKQDEEARKNLRTLVLEMRKADEDAEAHDATQRANLKEAVRDRKAAEKDDADAKKDLATAKGDRSRFTLQELAGMQGRFGGRFGAEVRGARDVQALGQMARRATMLNRPDIAANLQDRADSIRGQLSSLVEGERFPFKSLEENTAASKLALERLAGTVAPDGAAMKTISPMQ